MQDDATSYPVSEPQEALDQALEDVTKESVEDSQVDEQYQDWEQESEPLDWLPAKEGEHYSTADALEMLHEANLENMTEGQNLIEDPGLLQNLQLQRKEIKRIVHAAS